jgi:hypothetical protein
MYYGIVHDKVYARFRNFVARHGSYFNQEAAVEFQRILDHQGSSRLSIVYPLARLQLGRA